MRVLRRALRSWPGWSPALLEVRGDSEPAVGMTERERPRRPSAQRPSSRRERLGNRQASAELGERCNA